MLRFYTIWEVSQNRYVSESNRKWTEYVKFYKTYLHNGCERYYLIEIYEIIFEGLVIRLKILHQIFTRKHQIISQSIVFWNTMLVNRALENKAYDAKFWYKSYLLENIDLDQFCETSVFVSE